MEAHLLFAPNAGAFILSRTEGGNDEVKAERSKNEPAKARQRLIQRVTKQGLKRDQETTGGPRESAGAHAYDAWGAT